MARTIEAGDVARRKAVWISAGLLALAALLAYANSFSVPLLFDDWVTLRDNPKLRSPTLSSILVPPEHTGVGGRPVAYLSFVLNYALSGDSVAGYHAGNLVIHLCAGLALFGIVRRTLERLLPGDRFGTQITWLALVVAAWWMLHPVQTQSVTYVSQRTESLMGMFYFLTLYAFIRAMDAAGAVRWFVIAVASCFAGMATKEGMVTVPVIVFLYDYAFRTRSFRESWRQRWRWYVAMASSWLLLAVLMSGLRARGVGFGLGVSWWSYLLIECRAVMRYLALAFWPSPLVFDYGVDLGSPGIVETSAAVGVVLLAGATVFALWRAPALGFLGAWFLITLSPTSSVVPIPLQPISENRVYVPSAAVVAALAILGHRWGGRRALVACGGMAVGLACLTAGRNVDYRSEIGIWADTVAKRPASARAHSNYGHALQTAGRIVEAREQHEIALRLRPDYSEAHSNLAAILGQLGMADRALEHSRRAAEIDPLNAAAYFNMGIAWANLGNDAEAIAAFEKLLRLNPDWAGAHSNLALALLRVGRPADAIKHSEAALRLKSNLVEARFALGCGLAMTGRAAEAIPVFQDVARRQPNHVEAHQNLGALLLQSGRTAEAIAAAEAALRVNPGHVNATFLLANALVNAGRAGEAVPRYQALIKLAPNAPEVHLNLGQAYSQLGRIDDAITSFTAALRLNPNLTAAREGLERLQKQRR